MLSVLRVVRHVFWDDAMYDRKQLPSEALLEKCAVTLADLTTMTGQERITVFKQCGIDPTLFPLFLRALQHLTALHGPGSIDDEYLIHWRLSARQWTPFVFTAPLLGYPHVNSPAYRDPCVTQTTISTPGDRSTYALSGSANLHYNGLLNQGATCYLNSLLQALFHISAFRSIIYEMPTEDEANALLSSDIPETKSIPYALQRLFCMLQTGSLAVGTTELTESFGWSSSDSFIQHDVHELTRVLLDNLESKLNARSPSAEASSKKDSNAIHDLFNGSLENFVKVEEANYYGAREEPFCDLQLVVKNKKDIYESFDAFFQVEVLDGKNKYCLERDGTKTYHRAEKGVRLAEMPPIMLLHLARFDYDVQRGETKLFTRWAYYNTFDMSRYMPSMPPEYTHYTLFSVLVHSGSNTGFGHYFCFLRCSGIWYKFNDETVKPATFKEVFGANFGGYRLNYWGSEVPNIASAYMLVYIRTSQMDKLLRPIEHDDVPPHVLEQLHKEEEERERKRREQSEDHLYGRIHFIQPSELVDTEEFLTSKRPPSHKFSAHRTLRVLLEAEALPEFTDFVQRQMGQPAGEQLLWFSSIRSDCMSLRLCAQVKAGMKVKDLMDSGGECCVLVTLPSNTPLITLPDEGEKEYQIFHHKLYDPLLLKVIMLGSTVVQRNCQGDVQAALAKMEAEVRQIIAELPDETKRHYGHHLHGASEKRSSGSQPPPAETSLNISALFPSQSPDVSLPARGAPDLLHVQREVGKNTFSPCDALCSGDTLVWQAEVSADNQDNVFYPTVQSFQHFLRNRIPVEIKLNLPPTNPSLVETELASDMMYEQLQRYVARLVGVSADYDRIRFTRHNPDTDMPYFMKGRKKDRPTLTSLLTPAINRVPVLSKMLYYEYCKYTVTEIENAHSLQFKLYGENVKPLSSHWILMPRSLAITPPALFSACIQDIRRHYSTDPTASLTPQLQLFGEEAGGGGAAAAASGETTDIMKYLMTVAAEDAWKVLRLVDVWKGRIYNVLDNDHSLVLENQTFEESAEYRVELIPRPISNIPTGEQMLIQVHHFTMVRQRKDHIEAHSEPFSFYVHCQETSNALLRRIAEKLELSYAAVQDWKMCLVKEQRVVEVAPDIPMGVQLKEFCPGEGYMPNQKEPAKAAFLGLEHAPVTKRHTKREDKVVILN